MESSRIRRKWMRESACLYSTRALYSTGEVFKHAISRTCVLDPRRRVVSAMCERAYLRHISCCEISCASLPSKLESRKTIEQARNSDTEKKQVYYIERICVHGFRSSCQWGQDLCTPRKRFFILCGNNQLLFMR